MDAGERSSVELRIALLRGILLPGERYGELKMIDILVVDDKEIFVRTLLNSAFFKKNGDRFRVVRVAKNGVEAIEILRSCRVDITITDIRMPIMDGLDLLRAIKREDLCRCAILLSEYTDFEYAKQGIINGAFDYIVKPIDDRTLEDALSRADAFLKAMSAKEGRKRDDSTRLCVSMINDPPERFQIVMQEAIAQIDAEDDPDRASVALASKLATEMDHRYRALKNYLPIEMILTSLGDDGRAAPRGMLELRLKFLYDEILYLRLPSKHPLIIDLWHEMIENTDGVCRLQDLAERCFMNRSYLSTLFKRETGMRYKDFQRRLVLSRAKMMLSAGGQKISDIAKSLGFDDYSYFISVFRKMTGDTPGKWSWEREMRRRAGSPSALRSGEAS